jgi:type II secretory pathway component PulJ
MEPLAAISIVSSLLAFSSSSLVILQQVSRGAATVSKLQPELEVVELILEECLKTLEGHSSHPGSIKGCLELCDERRNDAAQELKLLPRPVAKDASLLRKIFQSYRYRLKAGVSEPRIISAYNSFKDSVLLLRDLTAE